MAEFKYEVVKKIAVLSERGDWTKEFNLISWNGREAKYDIREWNHKEGKLGKGITLSHEEIKLLVDALDISL